MDSRKSALATQNCDPVLRRALIGSSQFLFRWRRRMATLAVGLLAGWVALHVVSGPNGWMAYRTKKMEHQQLQEEVEQLRRENEELERRVKALKDDPKAIEREAREQLHYAKPGEIIYVMPEMRPPAPPQVPPNASAKKSGN